VWTIEEIVKLLDAAEKPLRYRRWICTQRVLPF
jgi:hypothetical protein